MPRPAKRKDVEEIFHFLMIHITHGNRNNRNIFYEAPSFFNNRPTAIFKEFSCHGLPVSSVDTCAQVRLFPSS